MFLAAIRLRYLLPHVDRPYKIPGGKMGMWLVAGLGSVTTLIAFAIGFIPPPNVHAGTTLLYESFLILALLFAVAIPLFISIGEKAYEEHHHSS